MNVSEYPRTVLQVHWRVLRLPYTVYEAMKSRSDDPQTHREEARRAFLDDFMGRIKGMAGFVMGDDDLIARGQIERAKAALRTDAVANESLAELRERAADMRLGEARERGADQRRGVAEQETQRKARALQEASRSRADVARKAERRREATKLQAGARRAAIEDAEGLAERDHAIRLGSANAIEEVAEDAKQDAAILESVRKMRKS